MLAITSVSEEMRKEPCTCCWFSPRNVNEQNRQRYVDEKKIVNKNESSVMTDTATEIGL